MRTTLPTSRRPSQAGCGRAAAATVLAVALGIGASLYPADIQGLIGLSPAERSTQHLDVVTPSVYAAPKRADVTLLRAPDLAGLSAGGDAPTLQTELLELARTYGAPELVETLEVVRFIQESLQGHQLVHGGGGGQVEPSGDAFLELVALMENLLQFIAGASGTELAGLISNVLPEVVRRWEIVVGPRVPAEQGAAAHDAPPAAPQTRAAPPPASRPIAPFTTAPSPTSVEPTSEPPAGEPPPSRESPANTTQQLPEPTPVPAVIEVEDPPSVEVTPEPVATAEPQPESQVDDPGSSTEPAGAEPEHADEPSSSNDDASVSNSDTSSHEQNTSAGSDAAHG